MARPLRLEYEGAIYHLCLRGNDRQRIFQDDRDRTRLVELLGASVQRFDVALQCFVLMGNHLHLVAETRRANLGRWMHWLNVAYTVFFNRRHRRSGHLFQGRYKSFLVQDGAYLLGLSRYVHLNPVRGISLGRGTPAERRRRLRAYKWSSYAGYAGLAGPLLFIAEERVLGELGAAKKVERLKYRQFVEQGLLREIENPFTAVQWQVVLGDESFVQKMRDRLTGLAPHRREITGLRRAERKVETSSVLRRVARKYGVEVKDLLRPGQRGFAARNVAMWMVWETGMKSLRDIGELFGGLDYAAVAQRIRRTRSRHDMETANKLIREMLNV